MTGERPERVIPKPTKPKIDKLIPVDVERKKVPDLSAVVTVRENGKDRVWGSGDPVPITGTASFGAATVTITVNIPVENSRSDYKLYVTQNGWSPSTTTTPIATSFGRPAGGTLGSTWTYTPGTPGHPTQDLTIQLTFKVGGTTQAPISYTIPGNTITNGANMSFVLA